MIRDTLTALAFATAALTFTSTAQADEICRGMAEQGIVFKPGTACHGWDAKPVNVGGIPHKRGYVEPWTQDWLDACSDKYGSFNRRDGHFTGYDGVRRPCVIGNEEIWGDM